MPAQMCAIDVGGLRTLLDAVNAFGRNPETGGFNRVGFSADDMAVRRWFAGQMRADGLEVTTDGAANVFGRYGPAGGPSVMVGSHLDTVPEGGAFDGALGATVGLACVRAIRDCGIALKTAIEVVATSEEEGRFGGMLGSQAIAGQVTRDWFESAVDADNISLAAAMRDRGLDPEGVFGAARPANSVRAFLELHVEQGPILEDAHVPIGIVDRISGCCVLFVRFRGVANHSGTTPMDRRADAFAGLAEVAATIPDMIREAGSDQSRVTIGKVELSPNFPHTIPGRAEFTVVLRDTDEAIMRALTDRMREAIAKVARTHRLDHGIETRSWLPPVALDASLVTLMRGAAGRLGVDAMVMPSGAGHDAQTMQAFCPSALVFVPSVGGISHAPQELTAWPDIEKGANLMLAALLELCAA